MASQSVNSTFSRVGCLIVASIVSILSEDMLSEEKSLIETRPFVLESVELHGTNRISVDQIKSILSLRKGLPLNHQIIMEGRSQLLELGLFQKVLLLIRKGSSFGKAKLVIEVEDDNSTLTPWALRGDISIEARERKTEDPTIDKISRHVELTLNSNNLWTQLQHGQVQVKFDNEGQIRSQHLAFHIPQKSADGYRFDLDAQISDPNTYYLDNLIYNRRASLTLSKPFREHMSLSYGLQIYKDKYLEKIEDRKKNEFIGPTIKLENTRITEDFPYDLHHRSTVAVTIAPEDSRQSLLYLSLLQKTYLDNGSEGSFELIGLGNTAQEVAYRGKIGFNTPLKYIGSRKDDIFLFVSFSRGQDKTRNREYAGSSLNFGLVYRGESFNASFTLSMTDQPSNLIASR